MHNGVKDAFRGIPEQHQAYYRGLWHEIVFNSDDQEDYAVEFLAEVNEESSAGRLDEEALRRLIARWYEDLLVHRAVDEAKRESDGVTYPGGRSRKNLASELSYEAGVRQASSQRKLGEGRV